MNDKDILVQKTVLENGIRIVTETMPEVRSIAIGVLIEGGLHDEIPSQNGIAHLVEHIMFQGTSARNATQIALMMDAAGGQMGAFTTRDYTCYTATVMDEYCTYALDLLGDILLNSIYPEDHLEREKEIILCEIEASNDRPDERVHSLIKSLIWPDHPLGYPIAGQPGIVKTLTREDVIYFVHSNYLPTRMVITAAGNIEHDDFVAQVRDGFWRMIKEDKMIMNDIPRFHSNIVVEHASVTQAYFSIGIQGFSYSDHHRYGMHVLNNVLGEGISSRLYCRMREQRGLVYHIGSDYHTYRNDGVLIIEGSTMPNHLIQVLALTLIELWKLIGLEEPVSEEELWKSKMHIRGQHMLSSENTNTRMSRLATQEIYFGRHLSAEEILSEIERVNSETFEQLSGEWLMDALSRISIAVVGPKSHQDVSRESIEGLLEQFQ